MRPLPTRGVCSRVLSGVLLGTLLTFGSACSSTATVNNPATFPQATAPSTTATAVSSVATSAPSSPSGVIGSAQSVGCDTDLGTMDTAVESFFALNGRYPKSEAELVQGGLLVGESAFHDVGPDGAVIPAPNSGCVR